MGLTSWSGPKIRKHDVVIAKNYLSFDEIKQLNLLVEQFLAFAESQAHQRRVMYMTDWIKKLNDILVINDREVLDNSGRTSKEQAENFAFSEFEKFRQLEDAEDLKKLKELEDEIKHIAPKRNRRKK
jgi:hypothetical protein